MQLTLTIIPGVSLTTQSHGNRLKNAIDICQHISVPKSHDAIAVVGKPPVANKIALAVGMLAAIDFDNKALFTTSEVGHIGPDRLLTYKLESEYRS